MKTRLACLLVALGVGVGAASCGSAAPVLIVDKAMLETRAPAEPRAEIDAYLASGSATVEGRVYARLPGMGLKYYPSAEVRLYPATPFGHFVYDGIVREDIGARMTYPTTDPTFRHYTDAIRVTSSDAEGRYRFTHLPAGRWFVMTKISDSEQRFRNRESSSLEYTMEPMGDMGMQPVPRMDYHPYVEAYTCSAAGTLVGEVTVGTDETVTAALALATSRGC